MKPLYAPFLLPSIESFDFHDWERIVAGAPEPLPEVITGWAPGTPIELRRSIEIQLPDLLCSSGLPPDTDLWINTSWIGSKSKIRERLRRQHVRDGINLVDVTLPEDRIGGTVTVLTTIVLANVGTGMTAAAQKPGSILARDEVKLVLEGDSSSFPTSVIDFGGTTNDPDASWHLVTGDDMESSFGGVFLLAVNERDHALVKAIEAEKPNNEQRCMVNAMMSGVGQLLLEIALFRARDPEFSTTEFADGSAGAVLRGLLDRSGLSPSEIPEDTDAADLRSTLQGAARRLGFGREL